MVERVCIFVRKRKNIVEMDHSLALPMTRHLLAKTKKIEQNTHTKLKDIQKMCHQKKEILIPPISKEEGRGDSGLTKGGKKSFSAKMTKPGWVCKEAKESCVSGYLGQDYC
jgi:hypothetical protein